MKKIFLLSFLLIGGMLFAQNQTWSIDKSHSNVGFSVSHLVITEVDGKFTDYDATLETDSKGVPVKVSATIKTGSINTDNTDRDNHLRSDDFFNSEKFPEMKFVSKSVKKDGKDKYKITGDLTIRDVTKTVTLDVKFNGQTNDPWGNTKSGWFATTKINRFDYNLKWNNTIETGGLVVGKEVTINLKLQFKLNK
jgi:polyisoprenoid-binding protein YceI